VTRAIFVPGKGGASGPLDREEAKETIANYISEFLQREGRQVGWLANKIGVHRTTISRLLHKKVLADPRTCRALAEVMGLPAEKVLTAAGYLPTEPDVPDIDDAELGFYLSQIGSMPTKTREIVKTILREEYRQMLQNRALGEELEAERPPFARKLG
jgi:transcriptional regulator with XRE-family HTH domain